MKNFSNLILILLSSVMISACGGGGGGGGDVGTTTDTVQQKVDLSWSAPSTRTDQSELLLSDLEGYRIYYGISQDNLDMQLDINDAYQTTVSINDLPPGIYYFAVTAYDVDGLESGFSEIVSKEISS